MTKQEKDTYLRCLGYAVKTYRLRRGMTQEQLAISSGYVDGVAPRSTMSKIERGKIDLTQSKIKDISEALGITPIDLMLEAERQLNNDHK